MSNGASGPVASPARSWLLATCAFGFVLLLWNTFFTPHYNGGAGTERVAESPTIDRVTYLKPGWPGERAGLRVGDKIDFLRGSSIAQAVAVRRTIAGRPFPLRVHRGSRVFDLSVVPIVRPLALGDRLGNLANWWLTVFATIVAWFGVGRRARLLSYLLIFDALGALNSFLSPWPWLNETALLLNIPVAVLSIALLATISSTFGRPISPQRRRLEWSTYAVTIIGVGVMQLLSELMFITPWLDRLWPLLYFNSRYSVGVTAAIVVAVGCAIVALATARGEERQRAAWLLIPLVAIFGVGVLWSYATLFAGGFYHPTQDALAIAGNLATLILLGVMTYAVLSRRRLVDVAFVVNRAAVFAGVSLVVVGIFVLAEFLFNKFFTAASRTTSIVVSVGVALAVGISLQYIHRYVDKVVDLVFFRARHEHERSLRAFAHEAAFITDSDTLLDNAVHDVAVHAETDTVSILVRDERGTYTTARSTNGATESVSENDRAILKLRAWHGPVDLDEVDTSLQGSRAYPLISRGDLLGVLVCGAKRDGQAYAPDESEALTVLARSVGSALDGLHRERRDDLKAAIDDLGTRLTEIHDVLQAFNPASGDGLAASKFRTPSTGA